MRRWLRRWLFNDSNQMIGTLSAPEEAVAKEQPTCRIGIVHAMNGKMLEVATYKRNQHGPDWTTKYWVLDETQPLAEQIAVVLTMHGLTK